MTFTTRSAKVDTVRDGAQEIDVAAFIAANIPQVETGNIIQNGVYNGITGDMKAEMGHRGLTSLHMSAMQDQALPGTFYVPAEDELKPTARPTAGSDESDDDDADEGERATSTTSEEGGDSDVARPAAINAESEDEEEEEQEDGEDESREVATPAATNTRASSETPRMSYTKKGEQRFNLAWVEAHPDEDYTHMGKGSWKRGLPQPGDNLKSGVRGPGAAAWKAANTGQ